VPSLLLKEFVVPSYKGKYVANPLVNVKSIINQKLKTKHINPRSPFGYKTTQEKSRFVTKTTHF